MRPAALLTAFAFLFGLLATAAPAMAQASGGCGALSSSGTRCNIIVDVGPGSPGDGSLQIAVTNSAGHTYSTINTGFACDPIVGSGFTPFRGAGSAFPRPDPGPGADPDAPEPEGVLFVSRLVGPDGAPTGSGFIGCVGRGESAPPPPPPPTSAEIWGALLTYEPTVTVDPQVRGVTGLETFAWSEGPTTVTLSPPLTLRGYTVTATADSVEYQWDLGGPDWYTGNQTYTTTEPGSQDFPAVDGHFYHRNENITLTHTVIWSGTATITGPGFPAGGSLQDLGSAAVTATRPYEVIEIRSVIVDGN